MYWIIKQSNTDSDYNNVDLLYCLPCKNQFMKKLMYVCMEILNPGCALAYYSCPSGVSYMRIPVPVSFQGKEFTKQVFNYFMTEHPLQNKDKSCILELPQPRKKHNCWLDSSSLGYIIFDA